MFETEKGGVWFLFAWGIAIVLIMVEGPLVIGLGPFEQTGTAIAFVFSTMLFTWIRQKTQIKEGRETENGRSES